MNALSEIKAFNRFITQPLVNGGWNVVDRVNGSVSDKFDTVEAAHEFAAVKNGISR